MAWGATWAADGEFGDESRTREPVTGWEYPVDEKLIQRISDSLLNGYGAVIDGDIGSGRHGIIHRVLEELSGRVHLVQFSALTLIPWSETGDRQDHVHALYDSLLADSGGLPIVVFVGNSYMVTEEWIAVLGALVIFGGISVLTKSDDSQSGIEQGLAQAAHLERIRILPISLDEARAWLQQVLHGPVTQMVAYELWSAAAGQRHFLHFLAIDWIEAGYLFRFDGHWVVSGESGPVGEHTVSFWKRILEARPPRERIAIEIVALSGGLPLNILLKVVEANELDSIHDSGILEFGPSHLHTVRLRGEASPRAVIAHIGPGRAATLLKLLQECTGFPSGISPEKLFDWERMSGVASSPEVTMDEIERSISEGNGQRALELLPETSELLSHSVRYRAARLSALIQCGHLSIAKQEIMGLAMSDWLLTGQGDFPGQPGLISTAEQVADVRLALVVLEYLAYSGTASTMEQRGMIERIEGVIRYKHQNNLLDDKTYEYCLADAAIVLAQLSMYFGQSNWIENQVFVHPGLHGGMLRKWQVALDTATVWGGGVDVGIHRLSEMTMLNHQSVESGTIENDSLLQLFGLKLVCGEWVEAKSVLDDSWMGGKNTKNLNHESLLYSGLLDSLMGRHEDAIAKFGSEVPQLKSYDPHGLLRVALAAMASSYAALGDLEAGRAALFSIDVTAGTKSFTAGRLETLFRIQAIHDLGSVGTASAAWQGIMRDDRKRGNTSWALLAAAMAVSQGYLDFADVLGELVQEVSGRFSEACGQFVEAFRGQRRDQMLAAAVSLESLGHRRFSAFIVEISNSDDAGNHYSGTEPLSRSARASGPVRGASLGLSVSPLLDDAVIRERWLKYSVVGLGLTTRQAEIAWLAGLGRTNREIADGLEMSIRTAESHLYQIFGKLGIRKRSDLSRMLQDRDGLSDEDVLG